MRKRFVPTRYHRNLYNFDGIKRGRGDRDRFHGDYDVRNRGDDNVDQNLEGHLKRKHLRYDSNFCSNLESWSDKDDRPINLLPMTPKKVYENPSSQINDIECVECLGYGYDECECLRGKVMTVESSTNVDMEMHDHEKKHEDQLCVKIHDQTYKIESEEEMS